MTYTTWRRQLAYSESLALRGLVRAHGRLPTFAPTVVDLDEHATEARAERSRQYRRNVKARSAA